MVRSWEPGETLGGWLKRRLKEKQWNVKDLAENTSLGYVTIYRMLKSKEFYIARSNTREALAWNRRTGLENLGYFGYPPTQLPKGETNNGLALSKEEKEQLKYNDFMSTLLKCDYVRQPCTFCQLAPETFAEACEPEWHYMLCVPEIVQPQVRADNKILPDLWSLFEDRYFYLAESETWPEINPDEVSKRIFVSTNTFKKYGAIRESYAKNFEVELFICRECIRRYHSIFLMPVPDLIEETMSLYGLDQRELAVNLGLDNGQSVISKILNTSELSNNFVEFVNPNILKKLIGIYVNGPSGFEVVIEYEYIRSVSTLEDHLISNGFKERNFIYNKELCISSTKKIRPVTSSKLNWNKEYSIAIACDLYVYSDDDQIRIACFFSPLKDERSTSLLLAVASNLGATHAVFVNGLKDDIYSEDYVCLNICGGAPRICRLPFLPHHYLEVKDLLSCELHDVKRQLKDAASLKASLKKTEKDKYNYFNEYFSGSEPFFTYEEFVEEGFYRLKSFFAFFASSNYIVEEISAFQEDIAESVRKGETTISEVAKEYSLSEEVIERMLDSYL